MVMCMYMFHALSYLLWLDRNYFIHTYRGRYQWHMDNHTIVTNESAYKTTLYNCLNKSNKNLQYKYNKHANISQKFSNFISYMPLFDKLMISLCRGVNIKQIILYLYLAFQTCSTVTCSCSKNVNSPSTYFFSISPRMINHFERVLNMKLNNKS